MLRRRTSEIKAWRISSGEARSRSHISRKCAISSQQDAHPAKCLLHQEKSVAPLLLQPPAPCYQAHGALWQTKAMPHQPMQLEMCDIMISKITKKEGDLPNHLLLTIRDTMILSKVLKLGFRWWQPLAWTRSSQTEWRPRTPKTKKM